MTFIQHYAKLPSGQVALTTVTEFIEARLMVAPGRGIRSAALYAAYCAWLPIPVSHKAFSLELRRLGLRSMKSGCIKWLDIALKS